MIVKPLVSVCVFAYNHEKYLAEALDSILLQKVNFDFEVIIGEDYSTDATLEIAQCYQAKHSDLIHIVQSGHKSKLIINGHPTGRYNLLNTLSKCRGKYIALLDGDDYWIDTQKLQKQVEYLEQHEECSFVFHNVYTEKTNSGGAEKLWEPLHPKSFSDINDLDKLLLTRNFVPTSSVVMRNNIPEKFPNAFYQVAIGDWPLHLFNLNFGQVKYIEDVMGIYRIGGGVWSKTSWENQLLLVIHTYKYFFEIIPPRLRSNFRYAAAIRYRHLIKDYLNQRKIGAAFKISMQLLMYFATGKIK
jgi:glycosyltransferase involved in cell wall biosynthesis